MNDRQASATEEPLPPLEPMSRTFAMNDSQVPVPKSPILYPRPVETMQVGEGMFGIEYDFYVPPIQEAPLVGWDHLRGTYLTHLDLVNAALKGTILL